MSGNEFQFFVRIVFLVLEMEKGGVVEAIKRLALVFSPRGGLVTRHPRETDRLFRKYPHA